MKYAKMARLILDSGAIHALAAGGEGLRRFLQRVARERILAVIAAVVIAETTRGGPSDAPVNRVIRVWHDGERAAQHGEGRTHGADLAGSGDMGRG